MASITTSTTGDGVRYVVNYRDPDGAQRRKTFRRKAEADAFRNAVEIDKFRGTYVDPAAGQITFAAYAAEWLAGRSYDEATAVAVELRLRVHVFPELGRLQLRQIKPSTIQRWLRTLDGLATTYRRVIYAHVSSVLTAAVDDDLIAKNPCKAGSVDKPSTARRKLTPWTAEMVTAMFAALPPRYRLTVTLGAGLGLRQGEIFGLSPPTSTSRSRPWRYADRSSSSPRTG
ncbi:tyrosine-type recombinase/integrase [Nocardioides zeae]